MYEWGTVALVVQSKAQILEQLQLLNSRCCKAINKYTLIEQSLYSMHACCVGPAS